MRKNKVLIGFSNNWGLDEKKVIGLALGVLADGGFLGVELSLVFVGASEAKRLNVKYRKMRYVPQVLSFVMDGKKDADGWRRLGDIVICIDRLRDEAVPMVRRASDSGVPSVADRPAAEVYELLKDWLEHGMMAFKKDR